MQESSWPDRLENICLAWRVRNVIASSRVSHGGACVAPDDRWDVARVKSGSIQRPFVNHRLCLRRLRGRGWVLQLTVYHPVFNQRLTASTPASRNVGLAGPEAGPRDATSAKGRHPAGDRLLEKPEVADPSNGRRPFNDQSGDIFSQQGARDVRRHISDDL